MRHLSLVTACILSLLCGRPAHAVDEIQVYNGEIARPGEWTLQQHLNYAIRGRRPDYPGAVGGTGTLNGTPELARGMTPNWELGAYVPFAIRGDRFYPAGGKLRSLIVTADAAEARIFLGLNTELSWQSGAFSRSRWNLEFRPILGYRTGNWEFIANPIVDLGIGGHEGHSFQPANRVAYSLRPDLQIGLETYSDLGPFGRFPSFNRQAHQIFAVTDFRLGPLDVNFGLGRGLTTASDRWVTKIIFGIAF